MIRVFHQYFSPRKIFFVTGEGILILLAATFSFTFLEGEGGLAEALANAWPKILVFAIITQNSLYFNDLYDFKYNENKLELATRLARSIGMTSIALAVLYALWPSVLIDKKTFFLSLVPLLLFLVFWRYIYVIVIKRKILTEKVIILGNGRLANDILSEIYRNKDLSYKVCCLLSPNGSQSEALINNKDGFPLCAMADKSLVGSAPGRKRLEFAQYADLISANGSIRSESPPDCSPAGISAVEGSVPIYYGFEDMCELAKEERIESIIVALDEKRGIFPYRQLLNCKLKGINIIDGEGFFERISGKLLVEKINPSWLIFSEGFVVPGYYKALKRATSLFISALLLILFFPLMVLVAIAIKIESPGPILFSQDRVGELGRLFTLYKFRSMRADAEELTGPVWATEEDPRITRVGKIIRKFRIDELPQLWNVLKGDMSVVGPRPERPFFVEDLKKKIPYYNERATVKPGVTGWAQVRYPYGASEEDAREKLKYDLYYIKNMSIMLDFMIILKTVKIVLLQRGSR